MNRLLIVFLLFFMAGIPQSRGTDVSLEIEPFVSYSPYAQLNDFEVELTGSTYDKMRYLVNFGAKVGVFMKGFSMGFMGSYGMGQIQTNQFSFANCTIAFNSNCRRDQNTSHIDLGAYLGYEFWKMRFWVGYDFYSLHTIEVTSQTDIVSRGNGFRVGLGFKPLKKFKSFSINAEYFMVNYTDNKISNFSLRRDTNASMHGVGLSVSAPFRILMSKKNRKAQKKKS